MGTPSDLVESVNGCIEFECSEFEHFWADAPSDMAVSVDGCSEFEHFWADAPSDMAEGVIGCRV